VDHLLLLLTKLFGATVAWGNLQWGNMRRRFLARAVCIGLAVGTSIAVTGAVASPAVGDAVPAAKAKGTPIKILSADGFYKFAGSETPGVEAALKKINASGGVGGRPLELTVCDATSVNKLQACGRQAAETRRSSRWWPISTSMADSTPLPRPRGSRLSALRPRPATFRIRSSSARVLVLSPLSVRLRSPVTTSRGSTSRWRSWTSRPVPNFRRWWTWRCWARGGPN